MANPEQLHIIKEEGVEAWNRWRIENPNEVVDLSDADLSRMKISGADLSMANLSWAKFFLTDLSYTLLVKADLSNANLCGTNLFEADLSGADLSKAVLDRTLFTNVDLSQTKGLADVKSWGPSSIGVDTIFKSNGDIPHSFLKVVGVPQQLIDYIPSFVGKPWEYYSCFISYSTIDQDIADRIYADLKNNGVRAWMYKEDIKTGAPLRNKIDVTIKLHDKLLLILSEASIASSWVETEVEAAFEKESDRKKIGNSEPVLFPIRIDNSIMETEQAWAANIRRTRNIGDFRDWKDHDQYQNAFKKLLRDLQTSGKPDK